jgi:putative membrane protein
MKWDQLLHAAAFSGLGIVVFAVAVWTMDRLAPFSIKKEIGEDQNTALAIVMGSILLGLAIIVAAAIHG